MTTAFSGGMIARAAESRIPSKTTKEKSFMTMDSWKRKTENSSVIRYAACSI